MGGNCLQTPPAARAGLSQSTLLVSSPMIPWWLQAASASALGCCVPAVPLPPLLQQNHSWGCPSLQHTAWPALGSGFCFDPMLTAEGLLASGCASALH